MNKRQMIAVWILGILFSILFFLFGVANISSYSLEPLFVNFITFSFVFIIPFAIIFGLIIYSLRNKEAS